MLFSLLFYFSYLAKFQVFFGTFKTADIMTEQVSCKTLCIILETSKNMAHLIHVEAFQEFFTGKISSSEIDMFYKNMTAHQSMCD